MNQSETDLNEAEKELYGIYDKLFTAKPTSYCLEASTLYTILLRRYRKEEIHAIAEILAALAKAPSFLDLEQT
ncbi:hypothetical protein [Candidatus Enterococcus ikei]|uniref:Uncharacterized protein n=1 Tax=Candidatus Enterococcus ikei TaxID=2815326 RepID=A0ABS3GWS0_9ENTE|nr:hypothetical protein [Enterococcus sp. DIV0869a]MBO0438924.1 hypothetical protein [Enterococcus sp. DIV0869a]